MLKQSNVVELFDQWTTYDHLVDRNYMFHRELYRELRRFLLALCVGRRISIMDLGCGSPRHLAQALEGMNVSRYLGVDLSATPLAMVFDNMEDVADDIEVQQGDLLEALENSDESFDLIFTSFALHHLSTAEKERFFAAARARLNDNGGLILIDVMREENESLSDYLEDYTSLVESWESIPLDNRMQIIDHIRNYDMPETGSTYRSMGLAAGFTTIVEISKYLWHRTWYFE